MGVIALTLVAFNPRVDVTRAGGFLSAAAMALSLVTVAAFFLRVSLLRVFSAYGGALLFAVFLVYDTQLIIAGKHSHCRFNVDDYAIAAMSVYMDIIRLFINLLRIVAPRR